MTRRPSRVGLVAVVAALTLTGGVVAVAAPRTAPSALPDPLLGHPGHPVVLDDSSFTLSGKAGSIVHLRFKHRFDAFRYEETFRYSLQRSGDWGGVALEQEAVPPGGDGKKMFLFTTTVGFSCGTVTSCYSEQAHREAEFEANAGSVEPTRFLPAGDYVAVLAGPVGSTITFTTRGYEDTKPPERVPVYPRRYLAQELAVRPAIVPALTDRARYYDDWKTPLPGRDVLAGVLLGTFQPTGGDLQVTLCPGSGNFHPSYERDPVISVAPVSGACPGYSAPVHNYSQGRATEQPLPGPESNYSHLFAYTARSYGAEGHTGAGYAYKGPGDGIPHGVGFVVELDG